MILRQGAAVCMIDTGEEENLPEIRAALQKYGIKHLDVLIISHFDKDHVGGAGALVDELDVRSVYLSAFEKDNEATSRFFAAMAQKGLTPVRLTENTSLSFGNATLTLSPPKQSSYPEKEDNNASLVVTAQYGEKRLLFCGDAMEYRIDELLEEDIGEIDFMKVPYHGRELENLGALLEKTSPAFGVITCSDKNPPADLTLALLSEHNVKTYLTSNGSVRVIVTASSLHVTQY